VSIGWIGPLKCLGRNRISIVAAVRSTSCLESLRQYSRQKRDLDHGRVASVGRWEGSLSARQNVLDATERLLRTRGLARTTTRAIAQEANCSEGTLFNHFFRKQHLFLAVILERAPSFRPSLIDAGEGCPRENLAKLARAAIAFFAEQLPVMVSAFADAELLARLRSSACAHKCDQQVILRLIASYIEEEQQLNRINTSVCPMTAASVLVGCCFQWVFIRSLTGFTALSDTPKGDFVADVVASLYRGLAPDSSQFRAI
jgi:AcrR family transcriptional regulator